MVNERSTSDRDADDGDDGVARDDGDHDGQWGGDDSRWDGDDSRWDGEGEGTVDRARDLNEPVPPGAPERDDGVDEALRETVVDDLADLADDDPDYPSGDDPIEPQRVDAENAAFVVLGVVAVLALVAVLVLSV